MTDGEYYDNPLIARYASPAMSALWGPKRKFSTWRRLWVALAEAEAELGLAIRPEQIAELKAHVDDLNLDVAAQYERKLRHDVMAHIHAYGDQCPAARGVIHLGATSCYVTDNTDLLLMREGLGLLAARLARVIGLLADFAVKQRSTACLAYTHLQPAQPTTVGKRACLWAYDLVEDLEAVELRIAKLRARGAKGTTGTQASFLQLFGGDHQKVRELDRRVAAKMGFADVYPVTGQTYSRKVDVQVVDTLAGIAESAHKAATDLRLLQSRGELVEPSESDQIGSSAMAYKRNPMRAERICGLARFVMSLQTSAAMTLATQWLERTLDDSANRRLVLPQAFLACDAILILYENIIAGLEVHAGVIAKNLERELPAMATESILMAAAAAGGDRQDLHERIRRHSREATERVQAGGDSDLVERLRGDRAFAKVDFGTILDASRYVGRSPEQVDEFVAEYLAPIRARYKAAKAPKADVSV